MPLAQHYLANPQLTRFANTYAPHA